MTLGHVLGALHGRGYARPVHMMPSALASAQLALGRYTSAAGASDGLLALPALLARGDGRTLLCWRPPLLAAARRPSRPPACQGAPKAEKPGEKPSSLRRLCSGSPQCSRTGLGRFSKLSSQVELT